MKYSLLIFMPVLLFSHSIRADDLMEDDLQHCYNLEFHHQTITSDVAFSIGECFAALADDLAPDQFSYLDDEPVVGRFTNAHAALHYACSWYAQARDIGHPAAEAQLMLAVDKLAP